MKVTVNDVVCFSQFLEKYKDKELSFRTAYKFNKFAKAIETDVNFFREKYTEVVNKYAEHEEDGKIKTNNGNIMIKTDCLQQYNKEVTELLSMEVEVEDMTFSIDELENLEVSIEALKPLMPFIEE